MGMYDGMLPEVQEEGKRGFYPVTTAQEWDNLPDVYKAMEWFPVNVYNMSWRKEEKTIPEYVEFDVIYLEPYKVSATVRVHVQEVQKILFCLYRNAQCHLYTVSGVVFQNGERWGAEWKQDAKTGSYAIYAGGKCVGRQGGFMGFIPENIEKTDNGFKFKGFGDYKNRCHYEFMNPFR